MARGGGDRDRDRDRERRRSPKESTRRVKKKICSFCKDHVVWVDYKDVNVLRRYMSDRGKIRARRVSGNCAQHQRDVAIAIKTARELALLPYTQRSVTERGPGRGRPPRDDAGGDRRGRRETVEDVPAAAAVDGAALTDEAANGDGGRDDGNRAEEEGA